MIIYATTFIGNTTLFNLIHQNNNNFILIVIVSIPKMIYSTMKTQHKSWCYIYSVIYYSVLSGMDDTLSNIVFEYKHGDTDSIGTTSKDVPFFLWTLTKLHISHFSWYRYRPAWGWRGGGGGGMLLYISSLPLVPNNWRCYRVIYTVKMLLANGDVFNNSTLTTVVWG